MGTLEQMERRYTIEALIRANGNRKDAAKLLGIAERTLYHGIKRHELNSEENKALIKYLTIRRNAKSVD